MALGFGGQGNKDQRMNREMFQAELQQERQQNALAQANMEMPENRDSELIRWQQSMDSEIEDACMSFRSMEKVNGKWQHIMVFKYTEVKDGKKVHHYMKLPPILNEAGISFFRSRVMPLVSKNILMSNYDEPRILEKLKNNVINFIIAIGLNRKEYNIKVTDLPTIKRIFQDLIEPGLFRAMRDGERRFLTSTSRRIEAVTTDGRGEEKKKGFLQGMMG